MPKTYLLGGENIFERSAREVNERAFKDAGEPLNILVFPWARASFDKAYKRRKRLVDYFISLGAGKIDFAEFSDSKETISEKICSATLVYLTGGLVSALIERLKNIGVDDLLHDYRGVIVGRSAGALALCRKCVITCRNNKRFKLINGLGLVNIALKVHYDPEKDKLLKLLSKEEKIFALPANSALVYINGSSSIIGEAYMFEDGTKRILI